MDKVLSKSRAVARSLDEQLDWVGWNPCYGRASRAVGDYLLWRETIIEEKAQQQHAAALDVYSPIFDSPPVTKASSTAGKAEPVRGVACMITPPPVLILQAGTHACRARAWERMGACMRLA